MKKTLLMITILFLSYSMANAKLYFDLIGSYTRTNDAWDQYGGGCSLGIDITEDINLFLRGIHNTRTMHVDSDNEESYNYTMGIAGLQYNLQILRIPLFWITSIGAGVSRVSAEYEAQKDDGEISDVGPNLSFCTGILYNWTQHLSPYIEIGYQGSFYNKDFSDKDIHGIQVLIGMRFTIFGKNRSIFEEY